PSDDARCMGSSDRRGRVCAEPGIAAATLGHRGELRRVMHEFEPELEELDISGLFDAAWYLLENPDVRASELDPLLHFCRYGWHEGRRPNRYFDPAWYLEQHPDVRSSEMNPLLHYLRHGDYEGRRPIEHFDPAWYRAAYGV